MYVDARKNKDGTVSYRFTYLDADGKRRRFPQSKVPASAQESLEAARKWAGEQAGIFAAKRAEAERRVGWRSQFYDFAQLLETYKIWQQKNAPNSWEACVFYLEQWVFPFFLAEQRTANVNDWYLHFQTFRDWLQHPDSLAKQGRKRPLAISTQNNIIKALNTFLTCLQAYNKIDPQAVRSCPSYPEHMLATRDSEAVILEPERDKIHARLRQTYPPAADFFWVAWHTGMRFAELFGLPITALFRGDIQHKQLAERLRLLDFEYHGYLLLESQPAHDDRRRESDGRVLRKPLKGRKAIGPKYSRVVPIRSKEAWNILATRYKQGLEQCATGAFGPERREYMLFEDAEWNRTVNALREAYQHYGLTPKGYHCCRHSYVTLLVGETGDELLVRMITGHKGRAFERYQHLAEQIALAAKQQSQVIDVI